MLGWINPAASQPASVASIKAEDLVEYDQQPEKVKRLIDTSLSLTGKNLAYRYGSATPSKGGMDCSGTISYVLKSLDLKEVPRMSHTIYLWTQDHGNLTKLTHVHHPNHPSLHPLKPGDLLFWEGQSCRLWSRPRYSGKRITCGVFAIGFNQGPGSPKNSQSLFKKGLRTGQYVNQDLIDQMVYLP